MGSTIIERVTTVRNSRSKLAYRWPEIRLSILLFLLFMASAISLGCFAYFSYVQKRLFMDIPWCATIPYLQSSS